MIPQGCSFIQYTGIIIAFFLPPKQDGDDIVFLTRNDMKQININNISILD